MVLEIETGEQVRDVLAAILTGVAGGTEAKWKRLIGPVQKLPTWQYVQFNWRVTPSGSAKERAVIEKAVEIVRAEHRYIRG